MQLRVVGAVPFCQHVPQKLIINTKEKGKRRGEGALPQIIRS